MSQSRLMSGVESATNMAVGYVVAVASQFVIYPFFGFPIELHQSLVVAGWFTVVSMVRSYWLRRLFNRSRN